MNEQKKLIAFMGGMFDQEKNSNFIRELETESLKQGYFIVAFSFSETTVWDQDRDNCELKLIELCSHLDIKAIIVQLEFIKNDYLVVAINKLGQKKGIPVIAMEKHLPGRINISMRYKDGFKSIVRHVIEVHGCRKINMLAGPKGDHFSEGRIEAYKEVLAENSIPFEERRLLHGDFWDRPAREATREFIRLGDEIDAIVCANDAMAIACADELITHGYRVPEDIIVTGFDGIKSGFFNVPAISTVEPDYENEAKKVISLISENIDPNTESVYNIDFRLKLRSSCGCYRAEDILSPTEINVLSASYADVNWAVNSINNLMVEASVLESMRELSRTISTTLWLWKRQFQFVGVFSDLLEPEMEGIGDHRYITMFRSENGERSGIGSTYDEAEFIPGFEDIINGDESNLLLVRLLHVGNQVFGYLVYGTKDTTNRDIRRCEEFGMFLSSAINAVITNRNLAKMRHEIEKVSVLDYLTGIYNRRGFMAELKKMVESTNNFGKNLIIFSIDMDRLKYINDMFGHAQGDFAIKSMAEAISHFASRNGIAARYGGDEFACAIITDAEVHLSADVVRSRLDLFLLAKESVANKEYKITASIGSASGIINNTIDVQSLMDRADEEMYADKKKRKANRE
jgi:diguanylate cyclase (GGDEF)-like protein